MIVVGPSFSLGWSDDAQAKAWAYVVKTPRSRRLQPRIFRAQGLPADREPDDDLRIAVQRLDADDGAHTELRVTYARAWRNLPVAD